MNHPRRPAREAPGLLGGLLHGVFEFFSRSIWELELGQLSRARSWVIKLARVGYLATRGFVQDRCVVRAAALTYVTILSIVPLLAVSFAAAKGFGFYDVLLHDTVEPFLDEYFDSAASHEVGDAVAVAEQSAGEVDAGEVDGGEVDGGEVDAENGDPASVSTTGGLKDLRSTIDEVLGFVQKTNFNTIGWPALLIFLYAVVKMLGTIEVTFNEIWGVTRSRSLVRKVSDYMSMVVITPLLLFLGVSVFAATGENELVNELGLGGAVKAIAKYGSWLSILGGFTFLYLAMPNTRVRFSSAMLGGVVAGLLWFGVVVLHVELQVGIANANALYSSFAALPIFLVFVNLCWIVVLIGAELAFAHQAEPTYREVERPYPDDHALREVFALRASVRIARRFMAGDEPATPGELALELGVPVRPVG